MPTGKVKWFDNKKGYGFIAHEGGQDVFVHRKEVRCEGKKTLRGGDTVRFDLVQVERGLRAVQVKRIE